MTPVFVTCHTAVSCLGAGLAATRAALLAERSGLAPCRFDTVDLDTYVGEVAGVDEVALPAALARFECRNNRLALLALRQDGLEAAVRACIDRYGAARVAVFIGTSTSGILQTEIAYRHRGADGALPADFLYATTHNSFSAVDFTRQYLGIAGPAAAVSCACASSAKVFAQAARMLACGLIDAALVGGVDSLCLTTLYGFHSLQLTSSRPCRPFDAARDGLSIGEAAAFVLLEREPRDGDAALALLGTGESSDAHHMSAPHPAGLGARLAMQEALQAAGLTPERIDYVNLHGTGTPGNDKAESKAVNALFDAATPCSSTKAATGHALGAAGALEAVISLIALEAGVVPAGLNVQEIEPELQLAYATRHQEKPLSHVLSNSFGFGGANCSLVFGRAA
ncbi:MAG: beta-ketoacyl-[acyl-carrier-protein] synthase family protein [Burkholderiales bacterium]